jgi:hypothetical protein
MAQLKISDLSVGDWGSDKNGIIAQIRGIECWSDGYVINVQTKAGTITNLTEAGVCPIPITPEILEKNGISKTYESDEYAVYKGEGFNVTKYYTELWEFERHRNRLMIRNVHQLQRAMRLAGVEKEIEL